MPDLDDKVQPEQKEEQHGEKIDKQEKLSVALMSEAAEDKTLRCIEPAKVTFKESVDDAGVMSAVKTSDGRSFNKNEDGSWTMSYRANGQDKTVAVDHVQLKQGKLSYDIQKGDKSLNIIESPDGTKVVSAAKTADATLVQKQKFGEKSPEQRDASSLMGGDALPKTPEASSRSMDKNSPKEVPVPVFPELEVPGKGQTGERPRVLKDSIDTRIGTITTFKGENGLVSQEIVRDADRDGVKQVEKRVEKPDGTWEGTIVRTGKDGKETRQHYTEAKQTDTGPGRRNIDVEQTTNEKGEVVKTDWVAGDARYSKSDRGLSKSWKDGEAVHTELWKDGKIVEKSRDYGTTSVKEAYENGQLVKESITSQKGTQEYHYHPPEKETPYKSVETTSDPKTTKVSEYSGPDKSKTTSYDAAGRLTGYYERDGQHTLSKSYDSQGRVTDSRVASPDSVETMKYDSAGKTIGHFKTDKNGFVDEKWDSEGRVLEHHKKTYATDVSPVSEEHVSYEYDKKTGEATGKDRIKGIEYSIVKDTHSDTEIHVCKDGRYFVKGPDGKEREFVDAGQYDQTPAQPTRSILGVSISGGKVENKSERPVLALGKGPGHEHNPHGDGFLRVVKKGEATDPAKTDYDGVVTDPRFQPVTLPDGKILMPASVPPDAAYTKMGDSYTAAVQSDKDGVKVTSPNYTGALNLDQARISDYTGGAPVFPQKPGDPVGRRK